MSETIKPILCWLFVSIGVCIEYYLVAVPLNSPGATLGDRIFFIGLGIFGYYWWSKV